jgi:hypothetical protein
MTRERRLTSGSQRGNKVVYAVSQLSSVPVESLWDRVDTEALYHALILSALGKTSVADHQWTAKQFWVDRQSFKQEDNIYRLENVQINKLNVYLQFKLKLRCVLYIRIMFVYLTSVSCSIVHLAHVICCYELCLHFACSGSLHRQLKLMCFFPIIKLNWHKFLAITLLCYIYISFVVILIYDK